MMATSNLCSNLTRALGSALVRSSSGFVASSISRSEANLSKSFSTCRTRAPSIAISKMLRGLTASAILRGLSLFASFRKGGHRAIGLTSFAVIFLFKLVAHLFSFFVHLLHPVLHHLHGAFVLAERLIGISLMLVHALIESLETIAP